MGEAPITLASDTACTLGIVTELPPVSSEVVTDIAASSTPSADLEPLAVVTEVNIAAPHIMQLPIDCMSNPSSGSADASAAPIIAREQAVLPCDASLSASQGSQMLLPDMNIDEPSWSTRAGLDIPGLVVLDVACGAMTTTRPTVSRRRTPEFASTNAMAPASNTATDDAEHSGGSIVDAAPLKTHAASIADTRTEVVDDPPANIVDSNAKETTDVIATTTMTTSKNHTTLEAVTDDEGHIEKESSESKVQQHINADTSSLTADDDLSVVAEEPSLTAAHAAAAEELRIAAIAADVRKEDLMNSRTSDAAASIATNSDTEGGAARASQDDGLRDSREMSPMQAADSEF